MTFILFLIYIYMDSINYYRKYLKYKTRYLNLKNSQKSQYVPVPKNANIYKSEKVKAKKTLVNYIQLLYKVLRESKSCFVKGTFIIDDSDNKLKPILEKAQSKKPILMTSHTKFGPYKEKDKICNKTNGLCEVNLQKYPVTIKCGNNSLERKNIKWYTFNNTNQKNNPQRFIFFKLEGAPTATVSHLISAINRYIIKKDSKSELPTRREDCKLEGNCKCKNKGCDGDPYGYKIGDNANCSATIQTYKRVGDEFFVPTELNNALLEGKSIKECNELLLV